MTKHPRIGVGVLVWNGDKLLLGERIKADGDRVWQFPGGHLEFGETVIECAQREVAEETGIAVSNAVQCGYTNDVIMQRDRHYVTLFVSCAYHSGEVSVMEPDKCASWHWFSANELPEPLFLPIRSFLKQFPDLRVLHVDPDTQAAVHK